MKVTIMDRVPRETEIPDDDLMSLTEAGQVLGMTKPGIINAIKRGELTEVSIPGRTKYRGQTMVLRTEVLAKK